MSKDTRSTRDVGRAVAFLHTAEADHRAGGRRMRRCGRAMRVVAMPATTQMSFSGSHASGSRVRGEVRLGRKFPCSTLNFYGAHRVLLPAERPSSAPRGA